MIVEVEKVGAMDEQKGMVTLHDVMDAQWTYDNNRPTAWSQP